MLCPSYVRLIIHISIKYLAISKYNNILIITNKVYIIIYKNSL